MFRKHNVSVVLNLLSIILIFTLLITMSLTDIICYAHYLSIPEGGGGSHSSWGTGTADHRYDGYKKVEFIAKSIIVPGLGGATATGYMYATAPGYDGECIVKVRMTRKGWLYMAFSAGYASASYKFIFTIYDLTADALKFKDVIDDETADIPYVPKIIDRNEEHNYIVYMSASHDYKFTVKGIGKVSAGGFGVAIVDFYCDTDKPHYIEWGYIIYYLSG